MLMCVCGAASGTRQYEQRSKSMNVMGERERLMNTSRNRQQCQWADSTSCVCESGTGGSQVRKERLRETKRKRRQKEMPFAFHDANTAHLQAHKRGMPPRRARAIATSCARGRGSEKPDPQKKKFRRCPAIKNTHRLSLLSQPSTTFGTKLGFCSKWSQNPTSTI